MLTGEPLRCDLIFGEPLPYARGADRKLVAQTVAARIAVMRAAADPLRGEGDAGALAVSARDNGDESLIRGKGGTLAQAMAEAPDRAASVSPRHRSRKKAETAFLARRLGEAEMAERVRRQHPAARRALQESLLD